MGVDKYKKDTAARKASGGPIVFPVAKKPIAKPKVRSLNVIRQTCTHESGKVITPCHSCNSGERDVRDCEIYGNVTRVNADKDVEQVCAQCKHYAVQLPNDGPRVGVVIGSYLWPELIELQIRLIRGTCGMVPILVSNDNPDGHDAMKAVAKGHTGVELITSEERRGHTGGDVAAYYRGIDWGAEKGLEVVCKLSQRMLITVPYWLQTGATNLLASGLPCSTRKATNVPGFPMRTEAVLCNVAQMNKPSVLARMSDKAYYHTRKGGYNGETVIHDIIKDELGGVFLPWLLLPHNRTEKGPGFVWHDSHPREDFDRLAARYGVTLPPDFTAGGWEWQLRKGEYVYG